MSGAGNGAEFIGRIDSILKPNNRNRNDLCKYLEISTSTVSTWKTKGTIPSADVAIRIADYLKVSVRWLVLGEEEPAVKENLTSEETVLLGFWRSLTPEQRNTVLVMVKALAGEKSTPEAESAVDSPVQTA